MQHANIVPYKEYFVEQEQGLLILIMEYCECKFSVFYHFLVGNLAAQIAEMRRTN